MQKRSISGKKKSILLSATLCLLTTGCVKQAISPPIVEAAGEQLSGKKLKNGVLTFRGIPYAAAPVNALRWRPPTSHGPRSGISDATKFGPACPQNQDNPKWYRDVAKDMGHVEATIAPLTEISEDCLLLNIWTADLKPSKPVPVMIWIHGGSNVNGWGHEPNYRGHNMARKGVVMVSINYRLGALGFMAHPLLSRENGSKISGHYGLLDQIAAIKWVKKNIAAFGGDPKQITLAGESAGGGNIAALIDIETREPLFQRAIIQSGALGPDDRNQLHESEQIGQKLIDHLGANTIAEMRALPWEKLVEARSEAVGDHYFAPIADGVHLKLRKAKADKVPLLIGSNRDEWRMYLPEDVVSRYHEALRQYGGQNAAVIDSYLTRHFPDITTRTDRLISAAEFLCPALTLASNTRKNDQPAYLYHFTRVRPGPNSILSYHGAEIPYMFDTADNWLPGDETDRKLTDVMIDYWANFVKSGDPNGEGLPYWPLADKATALPMELGDFIRPDDPEIYHICGLLQQ